MRRRFISAAILLALLSCGRNSNTYESVDQNPQTALIPEPSDKTPPPGLSLQPYYVSVQATFPQPSRNKSIDLIMSIDNSGSIVDRLPTFESDIPVLLNALLGQGIDFRVGALKNTEKNSNVDFDSSFQGPTPIVSSATSTNLSAEVRANIHSIYTAYRGGTERPVGIIQDAYNLSSNASFFRATAYPFYLIFSDAVDLDYSASPDSISHSIAYFRNFFASKAHEGHWLMSTLGVPSVNTCSGMEFDSQPMIEALTLGSGGLMGRVCEPNYQSQMQAIAQGISSFLTESSLESVVPEGSAVDLSSLQVRAGGVLISRDPISGYAWNPGNRSISFPGSYVPAAGTPIEVRLDYIE